MDSVFGRCYTLFALVPMNFEDYIVFTVDFSKLYPIQKIEMYYHVKGATNLGLEWNRWPMGSLLGFTKIEKGMNLDMGIKMTKFKRLGDASGQPQEPDMYVKCITDHATEILLNYSK